MRPFALALILVATVTSAFGSSSASSPSPCAVSAKSIGTISDESILTSISEKSIFGTISEQAISGEARNCGKVHEGSLTDQDLTVAGFSIGRSTVDDVIRRFPKSVKFQLTRGTDEALVGVCVKNKLGEAVVFASGYAGGWAILDSIYLAEASSFEKQGAKCAVWESLPAELSTDGGVRLGMERKQVLGLFRSPETYGSTFEIDYSTETATTSWISHLIKPSDSEGWMAMSGAVGGFKGERLNWIVLYATVSN